MGGLLVDGKIPNIIYFGDILHGYDEPIEVPIELPEDSVLIRCSKLFVKK